MIAFSADKEFGGIEKDMMNCPSCDEKINPIELSETRSFEVRKESIEIEDHFVRCPHCEEEWSADGFDAIAEVYRVYRERHRMVQPEALKAWRLKLGLTQEETSKLLGWSEATVVRYEKGALQDQSHDNELQMAMTPEGLAVLLRKNPGVIPTRKRAQVMEATRSSPSIQLATIEIFNSDEQTIETGFQTCSFDRLKTIIAHLVGNQSGVWKTTLNKLLWYADFVHFRDQGVGITGLRYLHFQYGPVPQNWNYILAALPEDEFEIEEECFPNGACGERIRTCQPLDSSLLSDEEVATLTSIQQYLSGKGEKEISDLSHAESGWQRTALRETISYAWAKDISAI